MVFDFHTHTSLSDGVLSPIELIRRAIVNGYRAIALTDHASTGELDRIIRETSEICALARAHWDILAIPGIEITHVPAQAIAETARRAKELGAWIVVVHGETIVEPVEEGTNLAALQSPHVDILAHPGLIRPEEAKFAAANGIFLEISARKGHCLTNGHVAMVARQAGARLLLNSDAHSPEDLLTSSLTNLISRGAGLDDAACHQLLATNPKALINKLPNTSP
ncbi:MAG TPA: histidinol phosphate phosphatase domain-containing protein [Dehalococcoidia bacterium]|nr:histidinol phosphate phosphatase domain-containing protein [Dehalococcoidia bacterium]